MRTKVIIDGLKNTQKFRAIINGVFIGDCMVKDLTTNRFAHQVQRVAVWEALMEVARARRVGANQIGFAGIRQGVEIQVDLV